MGGSAGKSVARSTTGGGSVPKRWASRAARAGASTSSRDQTAKRCRPWISDEAAERLKGLRSLSLSISELANLQDDIRQPYVGEAAFASPPLTTVALDRRHAAEEALRLATTRSREPDLPPRTVEVVSRLVVRESS